MKRYSFFTLILMVSMIFPVLSHAYGIGDICISLNGGADEVYTNQTNTLEIWMENDDKLTGMSFGLEIYWDPAVAITWNMSHGAYPPIDEHGRAVGAWDLTGVMINNDFDNSSPDHIGVGGAAMAGGLLAGPSEFCYSLEFDAVAPPGTVVDGFCVQPYFYPPSITWTFFDAVGSYPPGFCYYPISDQNNPIAPPECFDVIDAGLPCGDADGDGVVNINDVVYLINYLYQGGPPPIGDADVDVCGSVNAADIMYLIAYIFFGGPPPCAGGGTCYLPAGGNSVDLGCPITIDTPNGDSVAIPIYITNDTPIRALSLGFHHNSPDVEITSVSFDATVLPTPAGIIAGAKVDQGSNEVLIYWQDLMTDLSPQTGGLLATMWAQVPMGTPNQTIDIDSAFVGPGGEFIFCPAGGGAIEPAYNDCGTDDIVIFTPAPHVCGDVDCSSAVDIDDVVYLITYIFGGGPAPCDPNDDSTPDCGI